MPTTYTVVLSDVEQTAMEYVATDVDFWIQNVVHERARIAAEEMVADYIRQTLAAGGTVSGSKDEIVMNCGLPNAVARNEMVLKGVMKPPTAN